MENYYDAIIVGTGVAGCFSALHLPCDKKILMITKAKLNESDSFLAQGGICVQKGDEDYDSFFEDTMRAGHYENRKESVDIMIRSSRNVIRELIAYGVDYLRIVGYIYFFFVFTITITFPVILYNNNISAKIHFIIYA